MAEDEFGDFEAAPSVAAAAPDQSPVRAAAQGGVKGLAAPLPLEFFEEHEVVAAPNAPSWDGVALPAEPLHAKGDLVWYSQRGGSWVAAQVVSVDVSVAPPSYGVLVDGGYRETEGHRLCPHIPGQPAPSSQVQQTAAQVAAAPASHPPPLLQQQRGPQQPNGVHSAASNGSEMVSSTVSGSPAYGLVVQQEAPSHFISKPAGQPSVQPSAAPTTAGAAAEDDFGDFECAAPALTASTLQAGRAALPPQQPQQQAAPPAAAAAAVFQPPRKPPLGGQPALQGPFSSSDGFARGTATAAAAAGASGAADSSGLWQRWQQQQARSRQGSPDSLHRQQQQQQQRRRTHVQAAQVLARPQSPPPSPPKKPLTLQLPQQRDQVLQQQQQPSPYQQQQQPSPYSTPPRSPLSPRASSGQAAMAAESPLGSPRRSSPAVDRFHSFLRFAAPHAAQRIESQDQEAAAAAAGSSAGDGWGDFGDFAAGLSPGAAAAGVAGSPNAAAHMKGPQLGHGVDRCAPLPLDIFGEEEAPREDPPVAPLSQGSMGSPTVAGFAAAAAAPFASAPPASPRSQQGGATVDQQQQQEQQREEAVVTVGKGRGRQGLQVLPAASVTSAAVGAAAAVAATVAATVSPAPLAAPSSDAGDDWGEDSFGEFVDADPGSGAPEIHQPPWLPSAAAAPAAWPAAAADRQLAGGSSSINGCVGMGPPPSAKQATYGGERDSAAAGALDNGAAGMSFVNGMQFVNGTKELPEAHSSEPRGLGGQQHIDAAGACLPLPMPASSHTSGRGPSEPAAATANGEAAAEAVGELAFEDWGPMDAAEATVQQSATDSPVEQPGSPAHGGAIPWPAPAKPLEPQQEVAAPAVAVAALGQPQVSQAGAPPAAAGQWEEAVTEYGVAWVRLLEAAARELEHGVRLWREACETGSAGALLAVEGAQRYLASLGQVFLAAAVVQVAARLLGLYGLVGELQEAWGRCEAAWTAPSPLSGAQQQVDTAADTVAADTPVGLTAQPDAGQAAESQGLATAEPLGPGLSFQEAVLASSRSMLGPTAGSSHSDKQQQQHEDRQQEGPQQGAGLEAQLEALQQAEARAPGLSPDAFPRMLEWSEGLDGLTLVPLCLLEGALPVAGHASWLKGRPVLVPVANLWAGCLPRVLPDLD